MNDSAFISYIPSRNLILEFFGVELYLSAGLILASLIAFIAASLICSLSEELIDEKPSELPINTLIPSPIFFDILSVLDHYFQLKLLIPYFRS